MKIHLDGLLHMGEHHTICEDYVLWGEDPFPYIIISDGCSGSNHTDIGARLIVHAAKKVLLLYGSSMLTKLNADAFGSAVIQEAVNVAKIMDLPTESLDATLLIAWVDNGELNYLVYGDGCVAWEGPEGIHINSYDYVSGYPFYLSYKLDKARADTYSVEANGKMSVTSYGPEDSFGFDTYPYEKVVSGTLRLSHLEWFILSTDGINTFTSQQDSKLNNIRGVMEDLCYFKRLNGNFLQRRFKRFRKNAISNGYIHADDIGIAGLSIDNIN